MTGLKRFCQVGGDSPNSPRVSLAYPWYGYLKERGIYVELFSVTKKKNDGDDIGQSKSFDLLNPFMVSSLEVKMLLIFFKKRAFSSFFD